MIRHDNTFFAEKRDVLFEPDFFDRALKGKTRGLDPAVYAAASGAISRHAKADGHPQHITKFHILQAIADFADTAIYHGQSDQKAEKTARSAMEVLDKIYGDATGDYGSHIPKGRIFDKDFQNIIPDAQRPVPSPELAHKGPVVHLGGPFG